MMTLHERILKYNYVESHHRLPSVSTSTNTKESVTSIVALKPEI